MNKKGFMFVETIVMCAALMLGLLIIYNSYTSAITREKSRINYNTVQDQYKLIMVKQYLQAQDSSWKCDSYNSPNCTKANSLIGTSSYDLTTTLNAVKNFYNIEKVFLVKCETTNLDTELTGISDDFKIYLKTIKDCENNRYRFIGEFYDVPTNSYSYAWVEYPVSKTEAES